MPIFYVNQSILVASRNIEFYICIKCTTPVGPFPCRKILCDYVMKYSLWPALLIWFTICQLCCVVLAPNQAHGPAITFISEILVNTDLGNGSRGPILTHRKCSPAFNPGNIMWFLKIVPCDQNLVWRSYTWATAVWDGVNKLLLESDTWWNS